MDHIDRENDDELSYVVFNDIGDVNDPPYFSRCEVRLLVGASIFFIGLLVLIGVKFSGIIEYETVNQEKPGK